MYLELGKTVGERLEAYRALFVSHIDQALLGEIRASCNKGLALGSDRFKGELKTISGRCVTGKARGPKPK